MKKIFSAICLSIMLTFSSPCQAGLLGGLFSLFGGIIPVIEPASTASQLGKTISMALTEAKALLNKAQQVLGNKFTSKHLSFVTRFIDKISGFSNLMGTKLMMPAVSLEKELDVEDLNHNEDGVKRAIYRLFLEYPSDDILIQLAYRKKAHEFYDDTIIDVYSGSRELGRYLESEVAGKFADLHEKLKKGQNGAQESDNMNAALYNNYIAAHMTMDSIIAVVHEATALKAQLKAAKMIRDGIEPLVYNGGRGCIKKDGIGDFVPLKKPLSFNKPVNARVGDSYDMAFAQVDTSTSSSGKEDIYKQETHKSRDTSGQVSFGQAQNPMIINPLYENSEKIDELEKLEPIYDNLLKAFVAHNLINRLYTTRENFDRYHEVVKLHEYSKVQLSMSDQCAVNLLSNVFIDAGKVWCGYSNCININDYATRGGISAWGLSAYDTAQAAQVKSYSDDQWNIPKPASPAPAEEDFTLDTPTNPVDSVKVEEANVIANLDELEGNELDDEGRMSELLPWQIGAVGMESIASNLSAWGRTRDTFRVWNDVRSFYTQFVMFKYENFYTRIRADVTEYTIQEALKGWNIANRNNAQKKVKDQAEADKKSARANADRARANARAAAARAAEEEKEYDLSGALAKINADLTERINEIEEDLNKKLDSIASEFAINNNYIPKFTPIKTDIAERGDIVQEAFDAVISAGQAAKTALYYQSNPLGALYKQAKEVFKTSDLYLFNRIESAKTSMCPKGESIYLSNKVQGIHSDLVSSLAAYLIPIIDNYGETVYKVIPYKEYLASKDTTPETEEYYVGSMAKDRDLKAPKNPPEMTYAPFREVFHYDDVDWDNSKPISKKKFLNYGGKIPEIWKVLLSDKNPFVEHSFDLTGILDGDYLHKKAYYKLKKHQGHWCPELQVQKNKPARYLTLTRGGLTPCAIHDVKTNKVEGPDMSYFSSQQLLGVDIIEVNKKPYSYLPLSVLNETLNSSGVGSNPCVGITKSGNDFIFDKDLYHQKADAKFSLALNDIPDSYGRSELGVFVEAKGNDIVFREDFNNLFKEIEAIEAEYGDERNINTDRKLSNEQKIKEYTLYMTPFYNNMLGTNIMVAETEREYRETREKMEQEIVQLRQDLLESFASIGLEAPADLDLSGEGDYSDVVEILDVYKSARIKDIENGIKNTNVTDNHVLQTRLDNFKANLAALKQDKDEMVELGENSAGGAELAEEIEREKADRKAKKPYKEDESDSYQEALDEMSAPYCPNINDGSYQRGCPKEQNLTAKDER